MMKLREISAFLGIGLLLCFLLFGDAMRGRTLLAGVDVAPATSEFYRFVDPANDTISKNVRHSDQLNYDLPVQWLTYNALQRGEFPWWNPYTYGGRPFLADAHASVTDPVRLLCFTLLPTFELAYNWVFIGHCLLGGLSFFYLLRYMGVRPLVAGGLGLCGMFAGYVSLLIGYPWIHGAFVYYPWLWMAWDQLWRAPAPRAAILACIASTLILYTGNLQSHSYLIVFAAAFLAGYAKWSAAGWYRALRFIIPTGIISALLAAPVIFPELELFQLSRRLVKGESITPHVWDGLASIAAIWPWAIGSYHTFSYKLYNFFPYVGTAALLLAWFGFRSLRQHPSFLSDSGGGARRCAILLIIAYLVVMTVPPLAKVFYYRLVGIMVMGSIVLAAFGTEALLRETAPNRSATRLLIGFSILIAVGTAVAIFIVYPMLKPRLLAMMEAHTHGVSLAYRRAQVEWYPSAVGFSKLEVMLNWHGLVALAVVVARPQWRRISVPVMLGLNLAGVLAFTRGATPEVNREMWHRLLAGGPEHQALSQRLNPGFLRLAETLDHPQGPAFQGEFAIFYKMHVLHGYAALTPDNYYDRERTDWAGFADFKRPHNGTLEPRPAGHPARFQWAGSAPRKVTIASETLNTLDLHIGDGPAGSILRTDTPYPGWSATSDSGAVLAMKPAANLSTEIAVPDGATRIHLRYQPTGFRSSLYASALGLLLVAAWAAWAARRHPPGHEA